VVVNHYYSQQTIAADGTSTWSSSSVTGIPAEMYLGESFTAQPLGEAKLTEACLLTSPRRWRDLLPGGDGAFLLGEAAGFISASSFEGISSALISGKLLAEAFAAEPSPTQILRAYRKNTESLRRKLYMKTFKRQILCHPASRLAIMASGLQSIDVAHRHTPLSMKKAPRLPS